MSCREYKKKKHLEYHELIATIARPVSNRDLVRERCDPIENETPAVSASLSQYENANRGVRNCCG